MTAEQVAPAPCRCCGVAATGPTTRRYTHSLTGRPTPHLDYDVGTCEACLSLRPDEPGSAVRAALRLLDKSEADHDLAAGVFEEAGLDVSHLLYVNKPRPEPQRKPWAHVDKDTRAALRTAYVKVIDAKVHASTGPARPVPAHSPPDDMPRGCLACGVGASEQWYTVRTYALTTGPALVTGCVCATCAAVLESVGAVGATFLEKACLEAQGLSWSDGKSVPGLRAWVATGRQPGEPWAWVRVRDAPPVLSPVEALEAQVADLRAEVAALRAGAEK